MLPTTAYDFANGIGTFEVASYGVANAAKFYFGKNVSRINLNEAAMLAGILKAPSKLSPKNNHELAESRANVVLDNMINAGFLDLFLNVS